MATNSLAFFDQMNGVNYSTLSTTNFQLGIVDPDSSGLTSSQLSSLEASGKTIIGYLSIGEAEDYRSYWQSSWSTNPPSWLMGQDPSWPGDYYVQYWNPAWQQIVINEAVTMAKEGYNGIMLDVVDAYDVASVAAAAGGTTAAMNDMISFVEAISEATKAINPNFKIIQNNALELLTTNPNDPTSATNTAYLSHIDGVVAESTFYNGNSPATWTAWNVQYLEHAVSDGKEVLSIEYPTSTANQQSAITQAISDGFVPFIGTQDLNSIPSINTQIPGEIPSNALSGLTGNSIASGGSTSSGSTGTSSGTATPPAEVILKVPVTSGSNTYDGSAGNVEYEFYKHTGQTTINNFSGNDILDIESKIYSTAAQALSSVHYSGGNATLALDHGSSITLVGVAANSLTASDFHIFS